MLVRVSADCPEPRVGSAAPVRWILELRDDLVAQQLNCPTGLSGGHTRPVHPEDDVAHVKGFAVAFELFGYLGRLSDEKAVLAETVEGTMEVRLVLHGFVLAQSM